MKIIFISIFFSLLILSFQNCTNIETHSISHLSSGIQGTESLNGAVFFFEKQDLDDYLAQGFNQPGIDPGLQLTLTEILSTPDAKQNSTDEVYLCMVKSQEVPDSYYPIGYENYDSSSSIGSLVPICTTKTACHEHVKELDESAIAMISDICSETSQIKKLNSDQILQLVKRY